jgi:hypothetical protein
MAALFAAVAPDSPYFVLALFGAISALFLALGKVAQLLLARTDKAHEAEKASIVAGKDAVIAEMRAQLAESEARVERYEALALRLLHATEETTQVAREAVKRRAT